MEFTLSEIIWSIVALVALALVFDAFRRNRATSAEKKNAEPLTADQMEPTLTGRFRVQQMLDISQQTAQQHDKKQGSRPSAREGVVAHDEDTEALPDPFNPKK